MAVDMPAKGNVIATVARADRRMRILLAAPAYWPAVAFGGPTSMAKELAEALVRRGHEIDVLTTSLRAIGEPPSARLRSVTRDVGGVRVTYLATPLRYRWMGVTPTVPIRLARLHPDVVHVFGYRDVVTTVTAGWARATRLPYVFEPLDMFVPRYRNVLIKRAFDRVIGSPVARGARVVIANSGLEAAELEASGLPAARIATRANGFPEPRRGPPTGALRARLGLDTKTPLILSVGRISFKKGLDLLLQATTRLPGAHVAILGPDDGDGTLTRLLALRDDLGISDRVHFLGPSDEDGPGDAYADADIFVLPSRNESFGMVAAEAAAAGTAVVVTDRCGVAELLDKRGALVTECDAGAIGAAIERLLGDADLRAELGRGGRDVARETTWDAVAERQEALYGLALGR
jgi:glycosyltransferase involved in cell wall biosynthesis